MSATESRAPLALAAAVTTAWAAVVTLVPTVIVAGFLYAVDSTGGPISQVLRFGLAGWLLAHGVPIQLGSGHLALAPLTITAFAAWRVTRAGVHTARALRARRDHQLRRTIAAGLGVGVVYGLIGAAAASLAHLPGLVVDVPRAAATLGVFGLVTGSIGAGLESQLLLCLHRRTPAVLRDAARTGTVAALLVFAAGAALAGTAIACAGGEASQMMADYNTDVIGEAGLALVCLLYTPTFALWAASYLIGPGFVIGTGSLITATKVTLGALPAVPALAGLPSGSLGTLGAPLLGLPLAAGMAAGWLLARRWTHQSVQRGVPLPPWHVLLASALIAGPVAGAWFSLASLAASGSLGTAHLAVIGPKVGAVTATGTVVVALGSVVAAMATRLIIARRTSSRAGL